MTDLNSIEAANQVDARGSACPGPLLEAKKGIGKVQVGQILEILSNDEGTRNDILGYTINVNFVDSHCICGLSAHFRLLGI